MSDTTPQDAVCPDSAGRVGCPAPGSARRGPEYYVALALACGWLVVPAIQYYATFERTGIQVEESSGSPDLANLDLTPLYILLAAFTLGLMALRLVSRPRPELANSPHAAPSTDVEALS